MKSRILLVPPLESNLCLGCKKAMREVGHIGKYAIFLKSGSFFYYWVSNDGHLKHVYEVCRIGLVATGEVRIMAVHFCWHLNPVGDLSLYSKHVVKEALMNAACRQHREREVEFLLSLLALAGKPPALFPSLPWDSTYYP